MVYDFHTHTFLGDGSLSPIELIRRALIKGYRAIALTEHVATGSLTRIVEEVSRDCALARAHWGILAIPGVELTHVPAPSIPEIARQAKEAGAWLVVVHGETKTEPVAEGTNLAAVRCPDVDILAHPGLLTPDEARLAAANNVFIEITARKGHCLYNGHIALLAHQTGAKLLVSSDAHDAEDLLTPASALDVARGAGLNEDGCRHALEVNPDLLLERLALAGRLSASPETYKLPSAET